MKLNEIGISYSFEDLFENKNSRIQGIMSNQAKVSKLNSALQRDTNASIESVEQLMNTLADADPSQNGQFLNWIADRYVTQNFRVEDLRRVTSALTQFVQYKNKLAKKDINAYPALADVEDAVEALTGQPEEVSGKEAARQSKTGVKKLIDTPNLKVLIPTTEEAACFYGKGTKWCTAGREDNMFTHYSDQGNLYMVMANIGGKQRKFQLHYESDQFMNERDEPVSKADISALSRIPEYTEFLNKLISKHYGKYFM